MSNIFVAHVACQAPLSMGFPRQEYWSGLWFPSPGDLPNPGMEPESPALTGGFFATETLGSPSYHLTIFKLVWKWFIKTGSFSYCWVLRVLCVFWIVVLYHISFTNILSQQKFLILIMSNSFIFLWILPLML